MRVPFLALAAWLACDSNAGRRVAAAPASTPAAAPGPVKTAPPPPTARDNRTDGAPDCRFQRPAAWTGGQVSWLGACREGFAQGSGVLLDAVQGEEPERFYGLLEEGRLKLGVLQTGGGYVAGHWDQGAPAAELPDDVAQRNTVLDAFRAGAGAATSVSKSFAKKDAKSSRFYAKQARLLREQMD